MGNELDKEREKNDYDYRTTCARNQTEEKRLETTMKYNVEGYKAETDRALGGYKLATDRGIEAYKAETARRLRAIEQGKDNGKRFYTAPTFDSTKLALEGRRQYN